MRRRLTPEQEERLVAGAPFGDGAELDELSAFMRAIPAAVAAQPDERLSAALVPKLAEAARTSKGTETAAPATLAGAKTRRPLSRRTLVARVGVAVALLPAAMAGLAFAGVTVPEPASQAFEEVGVELPNQPSDSDTSSDGPAGDNAAPPAAAPGHKGNAGKKGKNGKALGHQKSKSKGNSGSNGNQGGNSGNAPGRTGNPGSSGSSQGKRGKSGSAPGQAKKQAPVTHGKAKGHLK